MSHTPISWLQATRIWYSMIYFSVFPLHFYFASLGLRCWDKVVQWISSDTSLELKLLGPEPSLSVPLCSGWRRSRSSHVPCFSRRNCCGHVPWTAQQNLLPFSQSKRIWASSWVGRTWCWKRDCASNLVVRMVLEPSTIMSGQYPILRK